MDHITVGKLYSYLLRPVHEDDQIELTIVSDCELVALSNELIFNVKAFIDDLMLEIMTSSVKEFPVTCYLPCPCQCGVLHTTMEAVIQKSSVFSQVLGHKTKLFCTTAVFISELLGGEISPPKFSDSPPKMLRHVVNYTLNTNISPSKFACSLPILVT